MDNNTLKKRPSIMEVLSSDSKENSTDQNVQETSVLTHSVQQKTESPTVQPVKEVIRERVVVQYRDKGRGCMPNAGCGCGCRTISCSGCLLIILAIVGIAYVIINKPAVIWSEVVTYLNAGERAPSSSPQDLTNLQDLVNSQISNIGEVQINLTQDQLTTLIRDQATQLNDLTIEVKPKQLTIYFYLDKTLPAKPLYGIVNINQTPEGKLEISRIGTGLIPLPDFVNKTATNTIYSVLNIDNTNQDQSPISILSSIFNSQNITIKSVDLQEGTVKITADIKVNLFEQ